MSNDHQHPHPPITTVELHRQPPPSTDVNNLFNQSPTTPTPVSTLAAAFGRAISNIPLTSFQDAAALRKLSDAGSSVIYTPTTTTTPPKVPRNNPLRRTLSDPITINDQQTHQVTKNITPLRRTISDTSDFIINPPNKTPRVSYSPQSSTEKQSKQSPQFERLRRIEDMVREVEQRCWEIMKEEQVEEDVRTNCSLTQTQAKGQEECVGVERLKNGDLRFELSCSCGKKFEMLIKSNGYCFYRLT